MIDDDEAQKISDALIRALYRKLEQKPCQACGAIEITAAEMNVLRQCLKDNEFYGIGAKDQAPGLRRVETDRVPFPQGKAAHG